MTTNEYVKKIHDISRSMNEVRIMEVCGGHTHTIMKYGIRELLPQNIKLISGPGCPVCITSQRDIDQVIELSLNGIKIATYGDMMHVPGTKMSLRDAQGLGADVKTIYSTDQLLEERDRVFFAVGFETTTPMTAKLVDKGLTIFCSHKTIPPAMSLLTKEMNLHGFIDPGHVSTIIGSHVWSTLELNVPQVISGFRPEQLIKSIYTLLELIRAEKVEVVNEYPEVVFPEGNVLAQRLIQKTMTPADAEWRGIGTLPLSGLAPRNPSQDARIKYSSIIQHVVSEENKDCRCGEVVRGLVEPKQCSLFGKSCTLDSPKGACMVSPTEGACAIALRYGKSLSE
ncbi:MAG: hydrogenase formation protein HypD [Candidatus Diapherotrites archaeon]|uniref:Hydrogenase formation protein HypD n=1 Tax=Candidatus Iainarchaeum sp. TaxID=3101447 RepID=A0A8T4C758_9ARCH|nr:hydrogenase formation protein HypD [Candidatus Diapherotrites archaeon]